MLYESNTVTEELLNQAAVEVTKHLPGRCKFCPRSFEKGEHIVFGTIKSIQMKFLEADIEKAEPAGLGEEHVVQLENAHIECALANKEKFRSVSSLRKFT